MERKMDKEKIESSNEELSSYSKRFKILDVMAQQIVLMKLQSETNNKLLKLQDRLIELGKYE
jgi:capsule polysaccharide export protein KpsE/RkpR